MSIDATSIGMLIGIATLAGLVWRMGALTATMSTTVESMKAEISELKGMRKELGVIPALVLRIEQLEKFTSSFPRALREEREREERVIRRSQGDFG